MHRETSAELARQAMLKVHPKVWRTSGDRTFNWVEKMEAFFEKQNVVGRGEVEWAGLTSLNELTGNLQPGRFFLIGAAPGDGKTAFLSGLARRVAHAKRRVGLISLRDSYDNVLLRVFTGESRVPPTDVRINYFPQMIRAAGKIHDCLPAIASLPHAGTGEACALIREVCAVKRLELVLVDDLDACAAEPGESPLSFLEKVNRFGQLARKLNVPLVGTLSLDPHGNLPPNQSRLKKDLLRFSNTDLFAILQQKPGDDFGSHEIQILRNALGPTATLPLFFNETTQLYCEIQK